MHKSKFIFIVALLISIAGCSSAPQRAKVNKISKSESKTKPTQEYRPDYYLKQAKRAYARSGDIMLRNQWLLKTAEAYKREQSCHQSEKIIHLVQPELADNAQRTQANLLLAECMQSNNRIDFAQLESLLAGMAYQVGFDKRINALNAILFEHKKRWVDAARAVLSSDMDPRDSSLKVWQLLQNLSLQDLQITNTQEPQLIPWSQLALMSRHYGLEPTRLNQAVKTWQSRFQDHPLGQHLPTDIVAAMNQPILIAPKIAVLLPLTGRLANQGQAIKQGILAAYFDTNTKAPQTSEQEQAAQVQFFDSALYDAETLVTMVTDFDLVIGPLLKDKLSRLLDLLPDDKPLLALNRSDRQMAIQEDVSNLVQNRYYFALAPEDEARQLAQKVRQKGIRHLVLVADNSNATKRMADAFISEWRSNSDEGETPPTLTLFDDNKSLRNSVTSSLDVAQSKSRIKQIEALATKEVQAVARNRRDVDGMVIFANAEQTELLNPIIESSLSPFGDKKVPVFASSRSYSLQLSKNSLRDLRNLTFTDMPWMLPEHSWLALSDQSNALWPERSDQLRRLFAFGFDSYNIVPYLRQLHSVPQLSIEGLTGKLSVDKSGTVKRLLPFGYVSDDKVNVIAMD